MADPGDVTVVIPAYDEEESIAEVVRGVLAAAPWREVLVVDDGSGDDTAARAQAAGARVIRHPYNKGNGAALKTGVREAQGGVLLFFDADGQHDPGEMTRLVEPVGVFDMVIGARSWGDQGLVRAAGNRAFTVLASWLTGRPIPDLTSGFRAAKRERLEEILHLLPNRFSAPTTSCLALLKAGHNVAFEPIRARPRVGRSKISVVRDGVRFVLIIVKIVTLYSPLRIFFPVAAGSFLLGCAYAAWNVYWWGKIPMGAGLLIQLAVVVGLFGLLAEQIAAGQERK